MSAIWTRLTEKHTACLFSHRLTRAFVGMVSIFLGSAPLFAQPCEPDAAGCPYVATPNTLVVQLGSHTTFLPVSTMPVSNTTAMFMVVAGETYEWSTRIADGGMVNYDSELTLLHSSGTIRLCYGNDSLSNGAFISWTAPSNGHVYLRLTPTPCGTSSYPSTVVWRCASCEPLPVETVPGTGFNTIACGSHMRLRDPGGTGYYPNNANGYTVLETSGDARVRLHGPYAIEGGFDQLRLLAGVGNDAAFLADYANAGIMDYTGAPGQTLTLRFSSDQNVFMAGFDLEITYEGTCAEVGMAERTAPRWAVHPNPSTGMITIREALGMPATRLDVFDLTGRTITQQRSIPRTGAMPLYDGVLEPGYYIVRIHGDDHTEEHRILVE